MLMLAGGTAFAYPCSHHPPRSYPAKAAFARLHPCPATGLRLAHCPGYVIDHVVPIVCCGADDPSNMQWQTIAAGKAKDRVELKLPQCRRPLGGGGMGARGS